jgi:hypothetical protein
MDFGNLAKGLGSSIGNELLNNSELQGILKGVITQHGMKLSAADIKGLLENEKVKQALLNAGKAILAAKLSGGSAGTAQKALLPVAEQLLAKAPDATVTKQDLAKTIQEKIEDKVGV